MAIAFHCEHCSKKIEAPDNAGGKWGKCPACHNKVYVPGLDSGEELKLAPIDKSDQAKQKQLMDETCRLRQDILLEREDLARPAAAVAASASGLSNEGLARSIIAYLQQMADGELDEAQKTAKLVIPCGRRALKILDKIALSEIPAPQLSNIPQQVLSSLIKDLRAKIR
jgi:hypothetical protein